MLEPMSWQEQEHGEPRAGADLRLPFPSRKPVPPHRLFGEQCGETPCGEKTGEGSNSARGTPFRFGTRRAILPLDI